MRLPVRGAELVGNELLGRLVVRNPEQRLGHAHQQHALLGRQIVLPHELVQRALVLRPLPNARHERGRERRDPLLRFRRELQFGEQPIDVHALVDEGRLRHGPAMAFEYGQRC